MRKFLKGQAYGRVVRLAHNFGLKIRPDRERTIDIVIAYCKKHKLDQTDLLAYDPSFKKIEK